jgi:hypothetical protein
MRAKNPEFTDSGEADFREGFSTQLDWWRCDPTHPVGIAVAEPTRFGRAGRSLTREMYFRGTNPTTLRLLRRSGVSFSRAQMARLKAPLVSQTPSGAFLPLFPAVRRTARRRDRVVRGRWPASEANAVTWGAPACIRNTSVGALLNLGDPEIAPAISGPRRCGIDRSRSKGRERRVGPAGKIGAKISGRRMPVTGRGRSDCYGRGREVTEARK